MSKYTTQLRTIIESFNYPDQESLSIDEMIKNSIPKIFNFDFPIWDEDHREELEVKIIRHYYMHEIGQETFGLFKFYLENTLKEIMPRYIQIYQTTILPLSELLVNVDENESYNRTYNVNSESNYQGSGSSESVNSDFPQIKAAGIDYASTSSNDSASNQSQNNDTKNGSESYTRNRSGLNGSKSKTELINEIRESIIDLDLMIINDLRDLFMIIY